MLNISDMSAQRTHEKRLKPRITCSYPSFVGGGMESDIKYESKAILANMSASGMYLRMRRSFDVGEPLFVFVRMSTAPLGQRRGPKIAAQGNVVRVDQRPDGSYGIAIQLEHYCLL